MTRATKSTPSAKLEDYQPNYESLNLPEWATDNGAKLTKTADFTWSLQCPWDTAHAAQIIQGKGGYPDFTCSDPDCAIQHNGTKPIMALWANHMDHCSGPFPPKVPGEEVVSPHDPDWKSPNGRVRSPQGHFINELGFDNENNYWYQTGPYGHVVKLHLGSHKELPLKGLVPLKKFWYAFAGNAATGKVDWNEAAAHLIAGCHAKGHFRPENVRGTGLWSDNGRIVVNLGNRLFIDGVETKIFDIKGDFFYDSAHKPIPLVAPASDDAIRAMLPLINRLPFAEKSGPAILTGMAIAGLMPTLLKWRPQLWIYGAQGSGKTQVMRHVLGSLWGAVFGSQCQLEGVTTEPAVRQTIGNSAFSVTLDDQEVDEDDRSGIIRINGLIRLARSSASDSDSSTGKGAASGNRANLFYIRSCFAFNSIACPIEKPQDRERFFAVPIKPQDPDKPDLEYPLTAEAFKQQFNKAFAFALFSRIIQDPHRILKIVESFTYALLNAGATYGLKRRYCDQWGTVLGCTWWTQHPNREDITADEALEFFSSVYDRQQYERHVIAEVGTHSSRALSQLLDYIPPQRGGSVSVAQMIEEVASFGGSRDGREGRHDPGYKDSADMWLRNQGMRVELNHLWVAIGQKQLADFFRGIGIANYQAVLRQYPGAFQVDKMTKFASIKNGYVAIPLTTVFAREDLEPMAQAERTTITPEMAEDLTPPPF